MNWDDLPPHPLTLGRDIRGGFYDYRNGDILFCKGRACRLDEALQDGDALVTFEDGSHDVVKWGELSREAE